MQVGDKVAYKAAWLKSVGADYELAQARGTVVGLKQLGKRTLVEVDWKNDDIPSLILNVNLCKVGSAAFGDSHTL